MSTSADRIRAARSLIRVEDGAFASRLLAARADPGVRVRVLGVLRWLRPLDAVLARRCSRPIEQLDAEVRAGLRIGLFEACILGVPAAVATDSAVRLVRRLGHGSASGLVNAVLRRAVADWPGRMEAASPDLRLSHPAWLYRRWRDRYGRSAADGVMAANQRPAPVWAWFFADSFRKELEDRGTALERHPWCPGAWSEAEGSGRLIEAVRRGEAFVQDPSSQLVSLVGADLGGDGCRFVDLCAAPGGKTAGISLRATPSRVVACDLRLGRVRLMASSLERLGGCSLLVADSTSPPFAGGSFDLVILDAPCSGTGTLRRHPELRWRLRPGSIGEMAALQKQLCGAALDLVAPGGVLVYATCSIESEENEDHFLEPPTGFDAVDLTEVLPAGVPAAPTDAGGVRILPHEHGDGFTIHALRRKPTQPVRQTAIRPVSRREHR